MFELFIWVSIVILLIALVYFAIQSLIEANSMIKDIELIRLENERLLSEIEQKCASYSGNYGSVGNE